MTVTHSAEKPFGFSDWPVQPPAQAQDVVLEASIGSQKLLKSGLSPNVVQMSQSTIVSSSALSDEKVITATGAGTDAGSPTLAGKVTGFEDSKHCSFATTITTLDKDTINELPDLPYHRWLSSRSNDCLREVYYKWFSVYRQIFIALFTFNLLGFGLYWAFKGNADVDTHVSDPRHLASYHLLTAVAANLMTAIAFRNEHIVNFLFNAATSSIPTWTPLSIRCSLAKVYNYGGLHSSCAVASVMWYLAYSITVTVESTNGQQKSVMVGLAWSTFVLLMLVLIFAYPSVRAKYHNYFECVHRFAGWTVLGVFWAQLAVAVVLIAGTTGTPTGKVLVCTPAFWLLLVATLLVIYPWLHLRRRKVEAEPLSDHAIRLHFDHGKFGLCASIRLTDRPLRETHAFATIPKEKDGFEVIVSNAGDWTAKIITNPPQYLWTRGVPARGVMGVAELFNRVVLVCTGSGIGPCLSFLRGRPGHSSRLVWATRDPAKTYRTSTLEEVFKHDPQAVILDSTRMGRRPDMVLESYKAYKEFKAEAIVVISNPKGTKNLVFEMEARGIPAFGPIWDS